MFVLIIFSLTLIPLCWYYGTKNYHYWEKRKVYCGRETLPFLGHIKPSYLLKSNLQVIDALYKSVAEKPYAGIYLFTRPALLVRDPDTIKKILVTDFTHFVSRGFHTNPPRDPLSNNLIHVNGPDWKYVRPKLQTAFTYNKLKHMVIEMDRSAKEVLRQIESSNVKSVNEKGDGKTFEAINVTERYMIDVLCSTVFGVKSNAVLHDTGSEFYRVGKTIFDGHHFLVHVFIGYLYPGLHKLLNLTVARKNVTRFFTDVSKEIASLRRSNADADKKNFVDTLIAMGDEQKSNKHSPPIICDEDFIAANMFMFFGAGFDSSAKVCYLCLFELAANPAVQDKARKEIVRVLSSHDGDHLDLEVIQKMTYLEQVVAEANRKYPILSVIFRRCDKSYTMPDGGVIDAGVPIIIPSSAIHHDPRYYPQPDKFDPERFSQRNKENIHPGTYLPFGMGPRICVAWQFAIVEIKVLLARILSEYTLGLHRTSNEYPLKLRPKAFLLTSESEIYISFSKNN